MNSRLVPALVPNRLLGVAWALVLAFLFVLAIDSFVTTPGGDSSIYTYVAKGMLQGEIPYLDRWENKGPLFYVLNLSGLVLHETWGIWVVQGLFLLGTASIAFLLLWRSLGILPALFALAIFLAYYRSFVPPGNYTEQFGLFFQFLTLYTLRAKSRRSHVRYVPITLCLVTLRYRCARRCHVPAQSQPRRPLDSYWYLLALEEKQLPAQALLGRHRRRKCINLRGSTLRDPRCLGCALGRGLYLRIFTGQRLATGKTSCSSESVRRFVSGLSVSHCQLAHRNLLCLSKTGTRRAIQEPLDARPYPLPA